MATNEFVDEVIECVKKDHKDKVENGKLALQGQATPTEWKNIVQSVAMMKTPEEAVVATEDVSLLESLLKHAHQYGEKASEYCVLEAKMYVRIASLYRGWSTEEKQQFEAESDSKTWRLVLWIKDKSDDDLAWIFHKIAEGRRIEQVRRDEMAAARIMTKQDKYKETATRIVESFKKNGEAIINVKTFCNSFPGRGNIDAKAACAWVDQARKEVRQLGGIGLGGGDGRYISASSADSDVKRRETATAVLNRLHSIECDLNRMNEICLTINIKPPVKEVNAIIQAAKAMITPVAQGMHDKIGDEDVSQD